MQILSIKLVPGSNFQLRSYFQLQYTIFSLHMSIVLSRRIASTYCRKKKKRIILIFVGVRNALDSKHLPYGFAAWAAPFHCSRALKLLGCHLAHYTIWAPLIVNGSLRRSFLSAPAGNTSERPVKSCFMPCL